MTLSPTSYNNLDEEWQQFIINNINKNDTYLPCGYNKIADIVKNSELDIKKDTHVQKSLSNTDHNQDPNADTDAYTDDSINTKPRIPPKCEDLYISTKTKVLFLNRNIDIQKIFWKIPVLEYWKPVEGVIKKQMKIVSKTPEEYEEYCQKLQGNFNSDALHLPQNSSIASEADASSALFNFAHNEPIEKVAQQKYKGSIKPYYYTENIIKQIHNPNARRIKFKDERKITIGLSKKDIINSRIKVKNAFYNCFAVIFRFLYEDQFREIHVKIFNTGKLEIPGILNTQVLDIIKKMILDILVPHMDNDDPLEFVENKKNENVLINSNFNCGYFINREKLHSILKGPKYGIETSYDPCSYPGVKCKFYFNNELGMENLDKQTGYVMYEDRNMKMSELIDNKKYTEVSFMIFRTGSCLIVGNCSEPVLTFIYQFIRNIFEREYEIISIQNEDPIMKNKNGKMRKKVITVSNDYYQRIVG